MTDPNCRLLVLSCSRRKRQDDEPLPAIERYDGPTFGVLRRFLKIRPDAALDVYILSAEYGLIGKDCRLRNYDRKMTPQCAEGMKPKVTSELKSIVNGTPYSAFCFCVGPTYLQALGAEHTVSSFEARLPVKTITGSSGRRLSKLYRWLYGVEALPEARGYQECPGKATLRGVETALTPDQVYEIARCSLMSDMDRATNYQTWYVQVGETRISPKWLVSRLTGLPVSGFHSDDARRVLHLLGIPVQS